MFCSMTFASKTLRSFLLSISIVLLLVACGGSKRQPSDINNICKIFAEKPRWYRSAKRIVARWGGNVHVPMAIIYQESSFKANARPPKKFLLGFIPTGRKSNAYGYSQALKSTWAEYEKATGNKWASRDNFGNAFDFVLWYMDKSHRINQVSKWNAREQYLNYHEGQGGFARGTHQSKRWLLNVSDKVGARAARFATQLNSCKPNLDRR